MSGREPEWVPENDKVLQTSIFGKFGAESRGRGEWCANRLPQGGNGVKDYAGVAPSRDDRIVGAEDPGKDGANVASGARAN